MVKVIYKISSGLSFENEIEAYRNDLGFLHEKKESLHKSLMVMKQEALSRYTKNYLLAREKAGERMEGVRKNDDPKKKCLVRQAYYEALAKKFEALNDLQIEIRAYKKIRLEFKEVNAEYKKTLELYKALIAKE